MDLKYLNTFRVIAEEGSFARAAEKLNYSNAAITIQINQLERELSVELFEKIGRKMVLTKAGENLLPYVKDVLSSVDRMCYFKNDIAECRGNLRIGVAESMLCYHVTELLKEFCTKAPNARLYLRSMNCYDIRNELMNGTLDVGIFYQDVGGFGSGLTTLPFGSYPLTLAASPKTKKRFSDFSTPDQQLNVPFIINEPDCIYRQIFEQYMKEKSISFDYTIEMWSIPTIKNLVKNDVGITILPRFTIEEELKSGILAEIPTELTHTTISAVCGYHRNKWISPLMQLFIDLCHDYTVKTRCDITKKQDIHTV